MFRTCNIITSQRDVVEGGQIIVCVDILLFMNLRWLYKGMLVLYAVEMAGNCPVLMCVEVFCVILMFV